MMKEMSLIMVVRRGKIPSGFIFKIVSCSMKIQNRNGENERYRVVAQQKNRTIFDSSRLFWYVLNGIYETIENAVIFS